MRAYPNNNQTIAGYCLLLCLILLPWHTWAAQDRALFWEIKSPTSTVYLLGSIHLADKSFYPLRSEIIQAFQQADNLVVEVDLQTSDTASMQRWVRQYGLYPQGTSLKDHLKASTYQDLAHYLKQEGMNIAAFNRYKPGLLVTELATMKLGQLGLSPDQGIDLHFIQQAKALKKPVLELESIQQQIRWLMEVPNGDLLIQLSLEQMDSIAHLMAEIIHHWKKGNASSLARLLIQDDLEKHPGLKPFYQQIFTKRNIGMANKIHHYLNTDGRYFVVVGAGHLIGDESIIDLLAAQGFPALRR